MPVFVIALSAIIEFGLYFSNVQMVTLASRVGAEAASETTLAETGEPPAEVILAINQHLQSAGITEFGVRLEHNQGSGPGPFVLVTPGVCTCEIDSSWTVPPGQYVRVSVCVPLRQLMPDLLTLVGFSVANGAATSTSVMLHE